MTEVKATSKAVENPMITVDGFRLKKLSIISTFSDTKKIDKAIEKFREDALSVVPDLSTVKSRGEIASIAYKISKKKTNIVSQMIDPSIEDAKAIVTIVGKGKAHFKTEMDALRDEVRKPLNEWEAAEKIREDKRISDIQLKITGIHNIVSFDQNNLPGKGEITELIESVDCIDCEQGFDEFTQDALQAKSKAKEILSEMLNKIIQKEIADKAALELEEKEAELEIQRLKQAAQERLNKLMMIPVEMFGKTSVEIQTKIDSIKKVEINESEFGELYVQAVTAADNVAIQLTQMFNQQVLVENAQQQISETPVTVNITTEQKPDSFTEEQVESVVEQINKPVEQPVTEKKVHGGYTTSRALSPHEKMIKSVEFWDSQYRITSAIGETAMNDLLNILNQYK